jgi:hypothetical protein
VRVDQCLAGGQTHADLPGLGDVLDVAREDPEMVAVADRTDSDPGLRRSCEEPVDDVEGDDRSQPAGAVDVQERLTDPPRHGHGERVGQAVPDPLRDGGQPLQPVRVLAPQVGLDELARLDRCGVGRCAVPLEDADEEVELLVLRHDHPAPTLPASSASPVTPAKWSTDSAGGRP